LQPFCPYDLYELPTLDILHETRTILHYGIKLDNFGQSTLGEPKSADGLQALQWWKEGNLESIRIYCQKDVEITKRLFEYGRENGYMLFTAKSGQVVRLPVEW